MLYGKVSRGMSILVSCTLRVKLGMWVVAGQITAIFDKNRANDDTSIKFGTHVLQVILIKSARLAKRKSKMAAIFQDGRQVSHPNLRFCLEIFVIVRFT